MMRLTAIRTLKGQIELLTGLHIGGGDAEMHIGGTDNPVIKNPLTQQPYIPGSSLKGKIRSLLEWELGVVGLTEGKPLGFKDIKKLNSESAQNAAKDLLRLFGGAPEGDIDSKIVAEIGPTRLAFWDCSLDASWVDEMDKKNLLLTETKMENSIDRIRGVALNPRNTERVPAGGRFEFRLSLRIHDQEDLLDTLLKGLKLLEITGLGGSGSRGYGKLTFNDLSCDGESLRERMDRLPLFEHAA